jgi:hypothetical protein
MSEPYDLPFGPSGVNATSAAAPDLAPAPGGPEAAPGPVPEPGSGPGEAAETERPPEPLGVVVDATGNAEVDEAVVRLRDADELPVQAHIEVYEDVHRGLRDALTALDENRG